LPALDAILVQETQVPKRLGLIECGRFAARHCAAAVTEELPGRLTMLHARLEKERRRA
jgi:hypothetical protein